MDCLFLEVLCLKYSTCGLLRLALVINELDENLSCYSQRNERASIGTFTIKDWSPGMNGIFLLFVVNAAGRSLCWWTHSQHKNKGILLENQYCSFKVYIVPNSPYSA